MFAIGSEGQSRLDILGGESREIREDLGIAHARRQPAKNMRIGKKLNRQGAEDAKGRGG